VDVTRGWIAVDLDGTLAMHGGGAVGAIGPPVPAMLARVKAWLDEGIDVRIFTARVSSANASDLVDEARHAIAAWCHEHLDGRVLPATAEKDYLMVECWDDRACQVDPNTGELATARTLRNARTTILVMVRDLAEEYGESVALDRLESFLKDG
jgi:hypothetical protein